MRAAFATAAAPSANRDHHQIGDRDGAEHTAEDREREIVIPDRDKGQCRGARETENRQRQAKVECAPWPIGVRHTH